MQALTTAPRMQALTSARPAPSSARAGCACGSRRRSRCPRSMSRALRPLLGPMPRLHPLLPPTPVLPTPTRAQTRGRRWRWRARRWINGFVNWLRQTTNGVVRRRRRRRRWRRQRRWRLRRRWQQQQHFRIRAPPNLYSLTNLVPLTNLYPCRKGRWSRSEASGLCNCFGKTASAATATAAAAAAAVTSAAAAALAAAATAAAPPPPAHCSSFVPIGACMHPMGPALHACAHHGALSPQVPACIP